MSFGTQVMVVSGESVLKHGRITVIKGPSAGISFTLDSIYTAVVGRLARRCDVVISSGQVSKMHCAVKYSGYYNRFIVTDFSANGTYVNGKRLPKNIGVLFESGTVLMLANNENQIELI